jgi:hypothetical protein
VNRGTSQACAKSTSTEERGLGEPWPEAAKTYVPKLKPIFREKVPVELV